MFPKLERGTGFIPFGVQVQERGSLTQGICTLPAHRCFGSQSTVLFGVFVQRCKLEDSIDVAFQHLRSQGVSFGFLARPSRPTGGANGNRAAVISMSTEKRPLKLHSLRGSLFYFGVVPL